MSLLSGGSLLFFGIASVLLTALFWSWPGLLVGLAMLAHGGLELRYRRRLIAVRDPRAAKILAANQLALGLMLTLYLATQIIGMEGAAVEEALRGDLIESLLQGLPASAQESLEADLRTLTKVLGYALLASLWFGCLAMAYYYREYGRSLSVVATPGRPRS